MPRLPSLRFLPPRVADSLIANVDRPLGFYISVLIGGLTAYAFVNDFSGTSRGVFAGWPTPAIAVGGFLFAIVGICLLLVVLWCVKWLLYTLIARPIIWVTGRLSRQGRDV